MDENTTDTTVTETPETAVEDTTEAPATDEAAAVDAPDAEIENDIEEVPATGAVDGDTATLEDGAAGDALTATGDHADKLATLQVLHDLSEDAIYLMGLSFILGVLFTVFILLVLDFMRRNANDTTTKS